MLVGAPFVFIDGPADVGRAIVRRKVRLARLVERRVTEGGSLRHEVLRQLDIIRLGRASWLLGRLENLGRILCHFKRLFLQNITFWQRLGRCVLD